VTRSSLRARGGATRALRAVLLILVALAGGWLVLKVTVAQAFRGAASIHYPLSAGNPQILLDHALLEAERGGNWDAARVDEILAAARRVPMAEEPFLVMALQRLGRASGDAQGEAAGVDRLLIEARARNPRLRLARIFLLDRHFRHAQVEEAAAEVAVLSRLLPEAGEIFVPEVARIARDRRFTEAIKRSLRNDALLNAVLVELARTGAEPELILSMAESQPKSAGAGWQSILIDRLVQQGALGRAREIWLEVTPGARSDGGLIYDAAFEGKPGVPPFNWSFHEQGAGAAGPAGNGTLEAVYYGREPAELAKQLLLLPPGRYRLRFEAEGDADGEGSRLEFRLSCASGGQDLMTHPMRNVTYSPTRQAVEFTVPSGCSAQWLTLTGVSAEFPRQQLLRIRELGIGRLDGR
jgi:hypothetical protein